MQGVFDFPPNIEKHKYQGVGDVWVVTENNDLSQGDSPWTIDMDLGFTYFE